MFTDAAILGINEKQNNQGEILSDWRDKDAGVWYLGEQVGTGCALWAERPASGEQQGPGCLPVNSNGE